MVIVDAGLPRRSAVWLDLAHPEFLIGIDYEAGAARHLPRHAAGGSASRTGSRRTHRRAEINTVEENTRAVPPTLGQP
jgi:hypothetical protein